MSFVLHIKLNTLIIIEFSLGKRDCFFVGYILGCNLSGAQIYNLSKTALQTAKAREMLGLGPAVGPGPTDDDGDGQGIMQVQPNMLNVAGPVVEDETIDTGNGDTEFVNRFEISPEARQAQGVAALLEDQAIAEMISKLYT